MSRAAVLTPGAPHAPSRAPDAAPLSAEAELAALKAENAALKQAASLPQVVYEPQTPKGKEARAASLFGHLTVAQLMAAIDAKDVDEPMNSVLCIDGYYVRRK
jgi:hypothetical protein